MLERTDISIALLDNGVDEKVFSLCGLSNIIQQNQGNFDDDSDLFIHGTNCAIVIGMNCANSRIFSYKILDNMGRGSVDALEAAFEWCMMNKIKLVNLSFGTTHFRDKNIIRRIVNKFANKGLIIVAATSNSGYTAFPASFSNVIGVKDGNTMSVDSECLHDKGVDFTAPSEHEIQLTGENIKLQKSNSYAAPYVTAIIGQSIAKKPQIKVCQVKKELYQRLKGKFIQYTPDWIEKGCIVGSMLESKAEVYFEIVRDVYEADTVILYDVNELENYPDKHIIYLGDEVVEDVNSQFYYWSRKVREEQILISELKKEPLHMPVILLELGTEQDGIWWLSELRKCFETDGYNAYTVSPKIEGVLYDLEYIPFILEEHFKDKIYDFIYWQTYYNQSDLIICEINENVAGMSKLADILVRVEDAGDQIEIQVCCNKTIKLQWGFECLGKQQIKEVYNYLMEIFMEDENEQ